ncbi:hypothetical protein U1Q18_018602 [Sarracenia purpurea var. burkii]
MEIKKHISNTHRTKKYRSNTHRTKKYSSIQIQIQEIQIEIKKSKKKIRSGDDQRDDGAQRLRGRRRTASRAVIEPQIELIEPEIELRSEETKTNSEETNSSNQKSTRSGNDDVAEERSGSDLVRSTRSVGDKEVERREQVAASGWAIDGVMLELKMRRQTGANGETDQISSPARGATVVARAEEDDEQVATNFSSLRTLLAGRRN